MEIVKLKGMVVKAGFVIVLLLVSTAWSTETEAKEKKDLAVSARGSGDFLWYGLQVGGELLTIIADTLHTVIVSTIMFLSVVSSFVTYHINWLWNKTEQVHQYKLAHEAHHPEPDHYYHNY